MPRIAITGHTRFDKATGELVSEAILAALQRYGGRTLHGVTCLAKGADQIFARAVLSLGGTYEVVVPAADYRTRIADPPERAAFDELLGMAREVHRMPARHSGGPAYAAANELMLEHCDALFAVWDGNPSRAPGDTADVVASARHRQIPVTVLWPTGAGRR